MLLLYQYFEKLASELARLEKLGANKLLPHPPKALNCRSGKGRSMNDKIFMPSKAPAIGHEKLSSFP